MKGSCHCGRITLRLDATPVSVTACNCTICRRYGALWAYGHIGHDIHASARTRPYRRVEGGAVDSHFCATCDCVSQYVATAAGADGLRWTAVNLHLSEPDPIAGLPIDHFDGLDSFDDLPSEGRTVRDMWF